MRVELGRGGYRHVLGGILDGEPVGAHFVPLEQRQAVGSEEAPNACGVPAQNFFEHGDEDAHGVIAEHGALGDAGDELGFRNRDGEAVVLIEVHHDRQIGAAITHIDDLVVADAEVRTELLEHGDFAPAGRGANDGVNFPGGFVVTEASAEDVIRWNDALERGLDNLLRRGGDDVEMELVAIGKRMRAESQRRSFSSTGTRTLMALSLMTVRLATRVMNLASETAMVRPS